VRGGKERKKGKEEKERKWTQDLNRHFSKDLQTANKHMKGYQTLLTTKECKSTSIAVNG
jgi:hypothetical protein